MSEQIEKGIEKLIILEITKELLRNTKVYQELLSERRDEEIEEIQDELESEEQKGLGEIPRRIIRGVVHEKIQKEEDNIKRIVRRQRKQQTIPWIRSLESFDSKPVLYGPLGPPPKFFIPPLKLIGPKLPKTVQDIRPVASTEREVDLGVLNPIIDDPAVNLVECNGPNERIVVMGKMGRKITQIQLTKEEIEDIIINFSEASRIPVHEGLFRVAVGKVELSAIVSETLGSKFTIKKIYEPPSAPTPSRFR
ncbi:hypothetical protein K0A97_00630 [Patescibacteria group bacterium]|nr:hypothetical protein [Patescibacteria group bacterium]